VVPGWPQTTQRDEEDVPLQISPSARQDRLVPVLPPVPPLAGAALQHATPAALPQVMQRLLLHLVPAAVQACVLVLVPLLQQAWPGPPQVPHEPFEQVPVLYGVHEPPGDTQRLPTQQPPASHELPSQQGPPGLPQVEG
jgi:hypothetical protein